MLDLLFYNFYDLDRFNRAGLGDGVLSLGNRDPLALYLHKKRVKELMLRSQNALVEGVAQDVQLVANIDEKNLELMIREASYLMQVADNLQDFAIEAPERLESVDRLHNLQVDYEQKYGRLGKLVEDALNTGAKKGTQWGTFISTNTAKNKFMNTVAKKTAIPDHVSANLSKLSVRVGGKNSDEESDKFSAYSRKSTQTARGGSNMKRKPSVMLTTADKGRLNPFGNKPSTQAGHNRRKNSFNESGNKFSGSKENFAGLNKRVLKRKDSRLSLQVLAPYQSGGDSQPGSGVETPRSAKVSYNVKTARMGSASKNPKSDKNTPKLSKLPTQDLAPPRKQGSSKSILQPDDENSNKSGSGKSSSANPPQSTSRRVSRKGSALKKKNLSLEAPGEPGLENPEIKVLQKEVGAREQLEKLEQSAQSKGEVNIQGLHSNKAEQLLARDIRDQLQNNINKDILDDLSSRLMDVVWRMQKSKPFDRRNSSIKIQRLLRQKSSSKQPNDPQLLYKHESASKLKKGYLGPAEILLRILQDAEGPERRSSLPEPSSLSSPKKINAFKTYEFGSGQIKEYNRSSFLFALEAFEAIYESVITHDLEVNSKERKFDYNSLLNLIKMYLQKILTQLHGWTESDKRAVEEIILRTEQTFFVGRLHKQFLSDKSKYMQMDVFKRLNEIEVISLRKLFKQIKHLLLNKKESYATPAPDNSAKVFELRMPPLRLIEAPIEAVKTLQEELNPKPPKPDRARLQPSVKAQLKDSQLLTRKDVLMKKPGRITARAFDQIKDDKFKKEERLRKEELEVQESLDYVDKMLNKYILKALFFFLKIDLQLMEQPMNSPEVKNYEIKVLHSELDGDYQDNTTRSDTLSQLQEPPLVKTSELTFQRLDFRHKRQTLAATSRKPFGNKSPFVRLDSKLNPTVQPLGQQLQSTARAGQFGRSASQPVVLPPLHRTAPRTKPPLQPPSAVNLARSEKGMMVVGNNVDLSSLELFTPQDSPATTQRSRIRLQGKLAADLPDLEQPFIVKQKHIGKSLTNHFARTNHELLKYLLKTLKAKLSAKCLQGVACQNPAVLPELRAALATVLRESALRALYLPSNELALDSQGRLTTLQRSQPNKDVVGKLWRIRGDIGVDASKMTSVGAASARRILGRSSSKIKP